MDEPILIVGTGAMACLLGARLSSAGVPVTLLGTWTEGLDALRTNGIRVIQEDGSEQSFSVSATANPSDCVGARLALVLVKSWQTDHAARQLAACLAPDGVALTLQNGLGNYELLGRHLGADRAALGVIVAGATLLGPGRVQPGGGGAVSLGPHPRVGPLIDALRRAGLSVRTVSCAEDMLWQKLVINAGINPLTALLRVPNGELLNRPSARALMGEAAREAASVARSHGRRSEEGDPIAEVEAVARRTGANRSSMLQDVERGARTEIDAICGAIVREGERNQVPVPVNRVLWQMVRALGEGGE